MKISVITINRNNSAGLAKTLESVMQQGTSVYEYIVIDGNSSDNSVHLIKNAEHVSKYLSEADQGIYDAMNKGIDLSSGDYIYFLNSGDVFYDNQVLAKVRQTGCSEDILYGNFVLDNKEKTKLVPPQVLDVPFFMTGMLWHPCVFTKKTVFDKIGKFNADFKITGDFEFLLRAMIKKGLSYRYMDITISLFDVQGISNQKSNSTLESAERRRSWEVNFSTPEIEVFEKHTQLLRSSEYKWGKLIKKIFRR